MMFVVMKTWRLKSFVQAEKGFYMLMLIVMEIEKVYMNIGFPCLVFTF